MLRALEYRGARGLGLRALREKKADTMTKVTDTSA